MKKLKKSVLSLLCALLLTGCGEDEALDAYQADMETFFEHVAEFDENMNAIDVGQEDYVAQLLEYLDALDAEVAWMAGLEVPKQFSAVDSLADEASENMGQAVSYFHMAYEAEEFNHNYEEAAREYYKRANIRIQYIIMLLHGEIPEGEGITYTEEENSIFGVGYLNKEAEENAESGGGDGTQE
ncbi:MAG: hypothetical protein NC341_02520 [Blautia sp.]|nr:hypothetical protein [Blautia sp.]MCM1200491.1 hypothetical protein [Bacteroides fragilis]